MLRSLLRMNISKASGGVLAVSIFISFLVFAGGISKGSEPDESIGPAQAISNIIFGRDPRLSSAKQIFRWSKTVKVNIVVDTETEFDSRNIVRSYVDSVGFYSNIEVEYSNSSSSNYFIIISNNIFDAAENKYRVFLSRLLLRGASVRGLINQYRQQNSICFSRVGVDSKNEIFGAITFISSNITKFQFQNCVGFNGFYAINPINGVNETDYNLYSISNGQLILSDFGVGLARVYYDPSISVGISREEFIDFIMQKSRRK